LESLLLISGTITQNMAIGASGGKGLPPDQVQDLLNFKPHAVDKPVTKNR
jgi:hypothetical protein